MDNFNNQTCNCGSGLQREENYDGYGIFLTYTCDDCYEEKMSGFRSDIHEQYDHCEELGIYYENY